MIVEAILAAALQTAPEDFANTRCGFGAEPELRLVLSPASKAFRRLSAYRALPVGERDSFQPSFHGSDADGGACYFLTDAAGEKFKLLASAQQHDLSLPGPHVFEQHPILVAATPAAGSPRLEIVLSPTSAPAESTDAARLVRGAVQADRFVRRQHGIIGWIAPGIHGVRFEWDGSAPAADAVFADGRRVPLPAYFDSAEFMPLKDRSLRHVVRLEFGRAPRRMVFTP